MLALVYTSFSERILVWKKVPSLSLYIRLGKSVHVSTLLSLFLCRQCKVRYTKTYRKHYTALHHGGWGGQCLK